jgi:hypothetical protein
MEISKICQKDVGQRGRCPFSSAQASLSGF